MAAVEEAEAQVVCPAAANEEIMTAAAAVQMSRKRRRRRESARGVVDEGMTRIIKLALVHSRKPFRAVFFY